MEFKNYKEKQKYYKQKAKETKMFWFSKDSGKPNGIVKGRTYVKKEVINLNGRNS